MGKILITLEGVLEQTVQLTKERMTIGRHRHNDIVLAHPTVSGEHAAITTILDDSFLEDLYSTNGTFVNGHRVGKHFLQHQDQVKLAKYRIEFVKDGIRPLSGGSPSSVLPQGTPPRQAAPLQPGMPLPQAVPLPSGMSMQEAAPARPEMPLQQAAPLPFIKPVGRIEVLNGSNAGRLLELDKPQTTLGRAGVLVVVISQTNGGYMAAHTDGDRIPLLNGAPLGKLPTALTHGDLLDLSGTRMTFRQA